MNPSSSDDAALYSQAITYLSALAMTQPRILALFAMIPIFNAQLIPGMLRFAIAAAFGAIAAPALVPQINSVDPSVMLLLVIIIKEVFIGFVMGYFVGILFYAFEAVGFYIDNQRGASVASTLNPLTGNDTSPLGILFNQAFIVFFFVSGGFTLLLAMMYNSFALWSVFSWTPTLREESMPLFLEQLNLLVKLALLLGSPAIVAMFLSEIGLALVSRFVPNLQVFFLAMPIKSAVAMMVLMFYAGTMLQYGLEFIDKIDLVLPTLNQEWVNDDNGSIKPDITRVPNSGTGASGAQPRGSVPR